MIFKPNFFGKSIHIDLKPDILLLIYVNLNMSMKSPSNGAKEYQAIINRTLKDWYGFYFHLFKINFYFLATKLLSYSLVIFIVP